MCPMCERAIGEDTPRVCPHCGWELLELEESAMWARSGSWAEGRPRCALQGVPETTTGAAQVPNL